MKCRLIEKKLIFYIENDLDANESMLVKAHLDNCSKCMKIYSMMKQNLDFVKDDILTRIKSFFLYKSFGSN